MKRPEQHIARILRGCGGLVCHCVLVRSFIPPEGIFCLRLLRVKELFPKARAFAAVRSFSTFAGQAGGKPPSVQRWQFHRQGLHAGRGALLGNDICANLAQDLGKVLCNFLPQGSCGVWRSV